MRPDVVTHLRCADRLAVDAKFTEPDVERHGRINASRFLLRQSAGRLLECHGFAAARLTKEDERLAGPLEQTHDVADDPVPAGCDRDLPANRISALGASNELQNDLMDRRDKGIAGLPERSWRRIHFPCRQRQIALLAEFLRDLGSEASKIGVEVAAFRRFREQADAYCQERVQPG